MIDVVSLSGWDAASMQIPGDGHWNDLGHAFVAEALAESLRNRLGPPPASPSPR